MPRLESVLTREDLERRGTASGLNLSSYFALLDAVREQGGVGATVRLGEGESQRTEKRRLSVAAKRRGYDLVWRTSAPNTLRFVLAESGQPPPGGRRRRPPAERQAEQTAIDAVMTADVAEVTATTAAPEESLPRAVGRILRTCAVSDQTTPPMERHSELPAVDAVVAEDPAGVSGTTTTTIGIEKSGDIGRGRRRRPVE